MRLPGCDALRILLLLAAGCSGAALAHGGGLDARGCHHNRKTGDYHCHRAGAQAGVASPGARSESRSTRLSFRNCAAARAAGAAPVRLGDPGYGRHLDRDGDGVGCE